MSIIIQNLSYEHPARELLFESITFSVNQGAKAALIGRNGMGKSTLLKIIAEIIKPSKGKVIRSESLYYVPQHFGQYNELTVAQALGVSQKLYALQAILNGETSDEHFTVLNDDWEIEERVLSALRKWQLPHISPEKKMANLSGGEKTKVFLAGISICQPEIILLDEPTNHLDGESRQQLYDFIEKSTATILMVSHDRTLLSLSEVTYELTKYGITTYGGNYELYKHCRDIQREALQGKMEEKEKTLRKSKMVAQKAAERKQKTDASNKKRNKDSGIPKIVLNQLQSYAENSSSKLKEAHTKKMESLSSELKDLQQQSPDSRILKLKLENANLHEGKMMAEAENLNYSFGNNPLWKSPLNFRISSGDRIVIKGANGSGKTTLLKLIIGELTPTIGTIQRNNFSYLYIDQEYEGIDNELSVIEQVERFNNLHLQEHELKTNLFRFLFSPESWEKSCAHLSGGEKIRLLFCCLTVSNSVPDMIILDEPTNNLDIESLEVISSTLNHYEGTLLVISHDLYFLNEIGVEEEIKI